MGVNKATFADRVGRFLLAILMSYRLFREMCKSINRPNDKLYYTSYVTRYGVPKVTVLVGLDRQAWRVDHAVISVMSDMKVTERWVKEYDDD